VSGSVDVAVIGAGILGCMTARELSRYKLDVVVLERANDIGGGSTKANSGLLHAGFHPRGGSLKGTSCVEGNSLYTTICEELGVPMRRVGGLFVAFHDEGMETIRDKYRRGGENGLNDLEIITGDRARELEPGLSEHVIAALYAPSTGIISPFRLMHSAARSAHDNGVRFLFGADVERIEPSPQESGSDHGYVLHTVAGDTIRARYVVNAAGEEAVLLDAQVRPVDLVIRPRRGQYHVFDKQGDEGVRHVLYQAQETNEGGTLIAPTIDGNLLIGPHL
jgi:glycerol-3-phosphate dehydrogenase